MELINGLMQPLQDLWSEITMGAGLFIVVSLIGLVGLVRVIEWRRRKRAA